MNKRILLRATLALLFPSTLAMAGGIANSAHDWTTESWNIQNKDVCGPCHMAHSSSSDQAIPLWSHQSTDPGRFTKLFTSPTVISAGITIRPPDGSSKACLSCHDGTLAYNQIGGTVPSGSTPQFVRGDYVKGGNGDLSGDHPISFSYVDASFKLGTNSLKAPTDVLGTTLPVNNNLRNQTVSQAFLTSGGDMQCDSCHDVHRQRGDSGLSSDKPLNTTGHNPLLVVYGVGADGLGSALCRSCHNK